MKVIDMHVQTALSNNFSGIGFTKYFSDAHETSNLGYCFSNARDMLLNAGFENIYYYIQRKPKKIALEKI